MRTSNTVDRMNKKIMIETIIIFALKCRRLYHSNDDVYQMTAPTVKTKNIMIIKTQYSYDRNVNK